MDSFGCGNISIPVEDIVVRDLPTLMNEMIKNITNDSKKDVRGVIYQEQKYKIDHDFFAQSISALPEELKLNLLSRFKYFNPRQILIYSCIMGLHELLALDQPININLLTQIEKSTQGVCDAGIKNYPISNSKVSTM